MISSWAKSESEKYAVSSIPSHLTRVQQERLSREFSRQLVDNPLTAAVREVLDAYLKITEVKGKRTKKKSKTSKSSHAWVSGVGYGGEKGVSSKLQTATAAARSKQDQNDATLASACDSLCDFLTSSLEDTFFMSSFSSCGLGGLFCMTLEDLIELEQSKSKRKRKKRVPVAAKHVSVVAMLRSFWRNDSVMDVGERVDLYDKLLTLVEILALKAPIYSGLPGILFTQEEAEEGECQEKGEEGESAGEEEEKEEGNHDVVDDDEVVVVGERNNSLVGKKAKYHIFSLMYALNKQGKAFAQTSAAEGERTLQLFKRMDDSLSRIHQVLGKSFYYKLDLEEVGPVKRSQRRDLLRLSQGGSLDKETLEAGYVEALKDLQFRSVALLDLASHGSVHYEYLKLAKSVALGNRQRMSRIGKEMSTMATSLPLNWASGIFIRVDEERPDILCCMILGPEDTPYQNGAFLFDIFLPNDYPNSPPKVLLKTTGHGSVRFNPNLYNCGKVCLSLLGTWEGPGWDPKTSTLLQVLVSIQSLILVPDPYFNEPGYESTMHTPHGKANSENYNKGIRMGTLEFGILEQITKPPYLFKDVLKLHFALKRNEILKQCEEWLSKVSKSSSNSRYSYLYGYENAGRGNSFTAVRTVVDRITRALADLVEPKAESRVPSTIHAISLDEEDEVKAAPSTSTSSSSSSSSSSAVMVSSSSSSSAMATYSNMTPSGPITLLDEDEEYGEESEYGEENEYGEEDEYGEDDFDGVFDDDENDDHSHYDNQVVDLTL